FSKPPFEDVLFWSTAAEYEAGPFIRFFAELYHESRMNKLGDSEFSSEPTSLTYGIVAQTPVGIDFSAGLAQDVNEAYIPVSNEFEKGNTLHAFSMKSVPDYSMFFQVSWSGFVLKQDNDGDGIKNKDDKCPDQAEDKDGFQDSDGCPDPDNDKDGI